MINNGRPFVSVIIVNLNGKDRLEKCLHSLSKTGFDNFETIVVDNGSTDGSVQMIEQLFPRCYVIELTENKGFAIANNMGTRQAKGEYFVFLNNDTIVTSNWLTELVSAIEEDQSIVIAQSMLLTPAGNVDSSGDFATKYGRTYSSKKTGFKEPREILSARGAAMIVRRSYFDKIGGFDEDYFISFEDVEMGWKAWLMGYRVVMVPSSIVYHEAGVTAQTMSSLMTFHGLKNQISLIMTHFEVHLVTRNLAVLLASLIIGLFKIIIIRDAPKSFQINKRAALRATIWCMLNIVNISKKYHKIRMLRKRSTRRLLIMKLITDDIQEV